jgi:hypothetical protein
MKKEYDFSSGKRGPVIPLPPKEVSGIRAAARLASQERERDQMLKERA